jgi:hypothetical protein
LNLLGEQQPIMATDQPSQAAFAVDKRQRTQVFVVEPEQIPGIKTGVPAATAHKLQELAAVRPSRMAFVTGNAATAALERGKALVDDLLAADQLAGAILYIGESAEAVVLQFENPVLVVKGRGDVGGIDWIYPGQYHYNYLG